MSNVIQLRYSNPITTTKKIQNINNTTQKPNDINISFIINRDDSQILFHINEKKGIIRKPSTPKPNALESFKPRLHELIPELKNLTGEELEKILEDEDEE